jgi:hypothetical protein
VVKTINDYGLSVFVHLLEMSADALAAYAGVELQVLTYFALLSVVCARVFSKEDLPICARCLHWNLTMPFFLCNCNGWTGCGHFSYIQHAHCKDVGTFLFLGPFRWLTKVGTSGTPAHSHCCLARLVAHGHAGAQQLLHTAATPADMY